jgi:iron complex transport system substrate-binding protein
VERVEFWAVIDRPYRLGYLTVLALFESVNELESSCKYSPPGIGGVAAHQEDAAKPPLKAQTGWSVQNDHPVRAFQRVPSAISFDGTATPPILGGDCGLNSTFAFQFAHTRWLALVLFLFAFTPAASAQTKPSRIVSITLATDEIAAGLVEPSRIVAVSQYAGDPQISNVAEMARKIKVVTDRDSETVVRLQPDVILSTRYTKIDLKFLMQQTRIPYIELNRFESMADIEANIRTVGKAIHEEHRAEQLIVEMQRKIASATARPAGPAGRAWKVLYLAPGDWTAGTKTTVNELIRITGLRNAAAEAGIIGNSKISIEHVIQIDPDVILIGTGYRRDADFQKSLERDPRFSSLKAVRGKRILALPSKYVLTTSQFIADGAVELSRRVKALP